MSLSSSFDFFWLDVDGVCGVGVGGGVCGVSGVGGVGGVGVHRGVVMVFLLVCFEGCVDRWFWSQIKNKKPGQKNHTPQDLEIHQATHYSSNQKISHKDDKNSPRNRRKIYFCEGGLCSK